MSDNSFLDKMVMLPLVGVESNNEEIFPLSFAAKTEEERTNIANIVSIFLIKESFFC
ncbi:hypothetical protein GVX81_08870 [[Haemophilus] felis]|nr:hypothetical protein [[Haemophilus] felis]